MHRRVHDGTARGHRIRGGTGGRTHQDAVGALYRHLLAVHIDGVLHHAEGVSVRERDVVDRRGGKHLFAVTVNAPEQKASFVLHGVPGEHERNLTCHVFDGDVGDEPQASCVDPDDGQVVGPQGARCSEHSSVAADDERNVAGLAQRRVRENGKGGAFREVSRRHPIKVRLDAGVRKKRKKRLEVTADFALRLSKDGGLFVVRHQSSKSGVSTPSTL